jgi:hypothetical protein
MLTPQIKKSLVLGSFVAASFALGLTAQESRSASLPNTSVTLSNSRLSFRGALTASNAVGSTEVRINTSNAGGNRPHASFDATQLQKNDPVKIGLAANMGQTYTVTDIIDGGTFTVTPALVTNNATLNDIVISTQSATLTVDFTTVNALNSGSFRVLVPARTTAAAALSSRDGIPDPGFFDYGATGNPTVTCTKQSGPGTYTGLAGTGSPEAVTIGTVVYHAFTCTHTGAGGIADSMRIVIDNLINPAPAISTTVARVSGVADAHNILVQHRNSANTVVDSTTVQVGVIEAVRVTASVAPQLTFRIEGQLLTTNVCGSVQSVDTTATTVPFGELIIDDFKRATQKLTVTTNAVGGYAVTARMNDQLGRSGVACAGVNGSGLEGSCIQDANAGSMSNTVSADWTTPTSQRGFGFSLQNDVTFPAQNVDFFYNEGGNAFRARHFSDTAGGETPQRIFYSTTVADTQSVNVCYRVAISASQAAGNYENYLTYTATATF